MAQETQVASSPTEVEDVFNGEHPTLAEFSKYREDGTLPERFQTDNAAPSTADTSEESEESEDKTPEPEPDSDPDELQGLKPKTAKRIERLLAEVKELKRQQTEKQDAKPAESFPVQQTATGEPTPEDLNADGSPKWKTYEDFTKALARHEALQVRTEWEREQEQKTAQNALKAKLDEARARYEDADEVIFPANKSIQEANIPMAVKEVFAQSDVFIDLCYVIGSDPKALADFIALAQSSPRAAIGRIFEYERGITEELSKSRDSEGKFTASAPKKTSAPKPPTPVGGTSSRAFDVSDDSLSPEEWMRKRNAQVAIKT
jgi:hypothetical protein